MDLKDNFKHKKFKIINNSRVLNFKREYNETICFDTETYKGKCKLIADSNKRYVLNPTFKECLDFMFFRGSRSKIYRFFFNIDFDISAILKIWNNISQIKKLIKGKNVMYGKYKLFWLKGIMFKITKGHKTVVFTDLFKFFKISLDKAIEKYTTESGKDAIDGNLLNTSLKYWNLNLYKIIDYCIKDSILTNKLAMLLLNSLNKSKVSLPKLMCSSGSIAKSDFRTNCYIPNLENIPKGIVQIAYNTYFGGKFEVMNRGYFKKMYLYDINSQYPSFIQYLPNLNNGLWKIINNISKTPVIGYYLVNLVIPEYQHISTIPYKMKNGLILNVIGNIKNKWLSWFDLDLMREFITKICFGIEFRARYKFSECNSEQLKYNYPFYNRINFHFKKKQQYKNNDDMMYQIHKLTMNSFYGCCIERHLKEKNSSVGKLFNPIYASQTTSFGRWSVIRELNEQLQKHILAIHTDSIITDKPIELIQNSTIGNWNLEKKGKGVIIGSGLYQIDDLCKSRGIPKKYIENNWLNFLEKNREKTKIEMKFKHMRKISECLVREKNLLLLNTFQLKKRSINVNSDLKRCWSVRFENFSQLLDFNINSLHYFVNMNNKQSKITSKDLLINPLFL